MASKVRDKEGNVFVTEIEGLTIYKCVKKAKRNGKDRIWIGIRQEESKEWRVSKTLCFAYGIDVSFEGKVSKQRPLKQLRQSR